MAVDGRMDPTRASVSVFSKKRKRTADTRALKRNMFRWRSRECSEVDGSTFSLRDTSNRSQTQTDVFGMMVFLTKAPSLFVPKPGDPMLLIWSPREGRSTKD